MHEYDITGLNQPQDWLNYDENNIEIDNTNLEVKCWKMINAWQSPVP